MQHKLYDKLVARLNDGTISVNTVKHPVSFGQVAVLVGCGEVHSNSLAGATSAESSAYDSAKVIINSVPSSSIDKIRDVVSPIRLSIAAFARISFLDRNGVKDFAELCLQVSTGMTPSAADISDTITACAKKSAELYSSSLVSEKDAAELLVVILTSAVDYQLKKLAAAFSKLSKSPMITVMAKPASDDMQEPKVVSTVKALQVALAANIAGLRAIFSKDKNSKRYLGMLDEIVDSGRKPVDEYERNALKEVFVYLEDNGFSIGTPMRKRYLVTAFGQE